MKHPVLVAFLVAAGICMVLAGVALAIYTSQQVPWALAAVILAFPFIWFFAWLVTNGVSWWQEKIKDDGSIK